jgi:glyceraldehyde 3-phosphate dehydrogenase
MAVPELLGKITGTPSASPSLTSSWPSLTSVWRAGPPRTRSTTTSARCRCTRTCGKQIDYFDSPDVGSMDLVGSWRAGILDGLATISNDKNL